MQAGGGHDDAGVIGKLLHHVLDACGVVGAVAPRWCKNKHVVIEGLDHGHATGYLEVVGKEVIRVGFEGDAKNTCDGR